MVLENIAYTLCVSICALFGSNLCSNGPELGEKQGSWDKPQSVEKYPRGVLKTTKFTMAHIFDKSQSSPNLASTSSSLDTTNQNW